MISVLKIVFAMKFNIFLVVIAFSILISCKSEEIKDYSLELGQYREMGIADPGVAWDFEEIRIAHSSLSSIKWDKPFELPRKDSEKSGLLFDRMISLENMTFLDVDTLKLHEKAYYSLEFLKTMESWKELYTNPLWKIQYYQRELVDININEVRVTQVMMNIAEQIMVSEDPVDKMMREGVPTVKQNYISSLINALHRQKETSEFLLEDIERMTDSLGASILRNREWLDAASARDIKEQLDAIKDSTSSDYVRERYLKISEIL